MEQGKYALELQWASQAIISEPVTKTGMRFVGLGNALLEYPSTFQTMYFTTSTQGVQATKSDAQFQPIIRGPLRARTLDGLEMYVSVSFQWKLEPQALIPLYNILSEVMYRDEFVRFARAALIKSCSKFPADMYFTNRTTITNHMLEELIARFNRPEQGLLAQIKGLQLQEVDLPDEFDEEIQNTQAQMQELEVAIAERDEKEVSMQTELLVAQQKVEEVLQGVRGEAESIRLNNDATVEQILVFAERQALANNEILQIFENDSQPFTRLLELMEVRAFDDHTDIKMLFNV
eukprot:CAMPEP_0197660614 /NCGR_PEP_ID=MMETSP1338-20131121/50953_1 /TAXON_ID=43686 ORGANISM="Pelagodinium beii, Strain RCC1491" /NCGR_SAMPLE_ID=MMETSP1338 /ASSEMBLY_ACC=CAM_ASM_000754 /LENGTH=290 /DNA_ID=CAMNT_0043237997 /DNA_START=163 /DNA_END=1035 /DNA_ORIENTATION=-